MLKFKNLANLPNLKQLRIQKEASPSELSSQKRVVIELKVQLGKILFNNKRIEQKNLNIM